MATTNPNVPAEQAAAATASAPNATVTAQQPAQLPPAGASNLTAVPAAQAAAPAKPAQPTQDQVAAGRKEEVAEEQQQLKSLSSSVEDKDYFEQQEEFAKVFEERQGEDSFRRAARIEREREALAFAGDPTRDPVAKQKAMDKNTVLPGAVEDAQKIKDTGDKALKDQSTAFKGVK